jgi:hypothetical protein
MNPDISEEIDPCEMDSLTGTIIGAAIRPLSKFHLSVNGIAPIHEAQLLQYLRLYGASNRGLLINSHTLIAPVSGTILVSQKKNGLLLKKSVQVHSE